MLCVPLVEIARFANCETPVMCGIKLLLLPPGCQTPGLFMGRFKAEAECNLMLGHHDAGADIEKSLPRFFRGDVGRLHRPAWLVGAHWHEGQVDPRIALSNQLEAAEIGGVTRKIEFLAA